MRIIGYLQIWMELCIVTLARAKIPPLLISRSLSYSVLAIHALDMHTKSQIFLLLFPPSCFFTASANMMQ